MSTRFSGKKHSDETKQKIREAISKRNRQNGSRFEDHVVFTESSSYNRGHLKKRIIQQELIPYICDRCNLIDEWNGKPLVLRLDHINGIKNDHRIDNLRFLCPNCDSQEPTYCGRNVKKNSPMV